MLSKSDETYGTGLNSINIKSSWHKFHLQSYTYYICMLNEVTFTQWSWYVFTRAVQCHRTIHNSLANNEIKLEIRANENKRTKERKKNCNMYFHLLVISLRIFLSFFPRWRDEPTTITNTSPMIVSANFISFETTGRTERIGR